MSAKPKTVAIIGGGWYGCYIALRLRNNGFPVTLYEANSELFEGTSKHYGIRLHSGPHYPRSEATRKECQRSSLRFQSEFPNLCTDTTQSIYCLGVKDSDGIPSRVQWKEFSDVCQECQMFGDVTEIDCDEFDNVLGGFSVAEPVHYLNDAKEYFTQALFKTGVKVVLNNKVTSVVKKASGVLIDGQHYDYAINCTYYQDFISEKLPFNCEFVYQPCLTLNYIYKEQTTFRHPFTFTVMDGWFPTLMPLMFNEKSEDVENLYKLYHAKYSILGNYNTIEECNSAIRKITDEWVEKKFKPKMEQAICEFYPRFKEVFEYKSWAVGNATKVKALSEHRCSLVWADQSFIQVFSGKVGTIFQAADDVIALLSKDDETVSVKSAQKELCDDNDLSRYKGSGSIPNTIIQ